MGNDFSSTFITALQAHKLILFEGEAAFGANNTITNNNENNTEAAKESNNDSSLLDHKSGILGSHLLAAFPNQIEMIHRMVFRTPTEHFDKNNRSDHVNAIAGCAAFASLLIAVSTTGGNTSSFFSTLMNGIGFVVCAFLINVSCVKQAQLQGRSQRTVLAKFFVSLCEGVVVGSAICWAKTYFLLGFLLVAAWVGFQVVLKFSASSTSSSSVGSIRPRALDFIFVVIAVALASSNPDNSFSPATMILAMTGASMTASIALFEIMRTACGKNDNKNDRENASLPSSPLQNVIHELVSPFFDVEVLLFNGFARFVFVTGLIVSLFGAATQQASAASAPVTAAIILVVASEAFRCFALSSVLKTPLFQPVTTTYIDGVFDMCHIGHKNLVNFASTLGNRVVAGVLSDEDCSVYKRPPVMTTDERVAEVRALLNVSRVVKGSPCFGLTEEFLRKEGIDVVVCGEEYMEKPLEEDKYYHVPRRMGIAVAAPRTGGISTSAIIKRIAQRSADDLAAKDKLSGASTVKE